MAGRLQDKGAAPWTTRSDEETAAAHYCWSQLGVYKELEVLKARLRGLQGKAGAEAGAIGASMEHLQACSGNMGVLDQGFLQALRGRDELVLGLATGALGSGEEGRLRRGLTDKLLRAVPPPGEFSGGPSGEPSEQ